MIGNSSFRVIAPGRVFLFGEHSDYLDLEVISAALNLAITITVKPRNDDVISIEYIDLKETDSFSLSEEITYRHTRDYLRSAFNVLRRKGFGVTTGANFLVSGTIPLAAGLSSSSALSVASVMSILQLAGKSMPKEEIVQNAFETEVVEFGESGGRMDHYASAFGGIIHVNFGSGQPSKPKPLPIVFDGLVIGDSLEKKPDTVGDIRMINSTVREGYHILAEKIDDFHQSKTPLDTVLNYIDELPKHCRTMVETSIRNRDLTQKALSLFTEGNITPKFMGEMLDQHHIFLRDGLKRSTTKIEHMISAVKEVGALGAKMNGSGGGGTMLAFAPGKEIEIMKAIEDVGGKAYNISIGKGARIEKL
ncbi:MAG: GHMP family kinase ATP-binding protein [Candidatus Heimdallarchaeota archaeon]